jgi:hypothetical protein
MKNIIFLLAIIFTSCNSGNNAELEQRLTRLENENKELKKQNTVERNKIQNIPPQQSTTNTLSQPPKQSGINPTTSSMNSESITRFVYVVIKTKEPSLNHREGTYEYGIKISDFNLIEWKEFVYTSKIEEILNFNEDKEFRLLDEAESSVQEKFSYKNLNFQLDVSAKVRDENERSRLEDNKAEIIDRKSYVL